MKKKMYVLRTWVSDDKDYHSHPTKLSVYIADNRLNDNAIDKQPYITTSRLSAKKFYTKKEAIKYGKQFGDCYVDCVWLKDDVLNIPTVIWN